MIRVKDLTLSLGSQSILHQVSFTVGPGQSLSILGPSGSGKTTLLRAVAGFHRRFDSGAIFIDQTKVQEEKNLFISANKRKCIMLFQDIALWPHLNVTDHLRLSAYLSKNKNKSNLTSPSQALKLVNLTHRQDAFPKDLSGGEKQRLALARALLGNPSALLLDEPFSSLDLQQKLELTKLVKELQKQYGFSLLHVTHDPFEALHLSEHMGLLQAGKLVWVGSAKEFKQTAHPSLRDLGHAMQAWQHAP
jgi:iron(III) transport system ATP-binding protein